MVPEEMARVTEVIALLARIVIAIWVVRRARRGPIVPRVGVSLVRPAPSPSYVECVYGWYVKRASSPGWYKPVARCALVGLSRGGAQLHALYARTVASQAKARRSATNAVK